MNEKDKWTGVVIAILVYTLMLSLLLFAGGCASNTLPEEELERRQYNRQASVENWNLCEQIYLSAGQLTWHIGHTHSNKGRRVDIFAVRQDLLDNRCRQLLGDYWIEQQ
jgi:hypothetical protein